MAVKYEHITCTGCGHTWYSPSKSTFGQCAKCNCKTLDYKESNAWEALEAMEKIDYINKLAKYKRQYEALLEFESQFGRQVIDGAYAIKFFSMKIDRSELPKIRKIVGRIEVVGKDVPYDYDDTHEIVVQLRPKDEKFNFMRFEYRREYDGMRCKIVEQVTKSKVFVCEKE